MLVLGADRLVADHLHETTLAHERLRHENPLGGFIREYASTDQARRQSLRHVNKLR